MPLPAFAIPAAFARLTDAHFGDAGSEWMARLPFLLAHCAAQWRLTPLPPFMLSYNYVAPAVRDDGTSVVLKVGFPHTDLFTEMDALQIYEGRGIARLLAHDRERGAMLIEHIQPGTLLSTLAVTATDEQATTIAANVMRNLWRPAPPAHNFPSVADWARELPELRARFDGGTGPLPVRLVEQAETLFAELLPSQSAPVLLHGDLHHFNILQAEDGSWKAIDPKGIIGEAEYEVGALLRNPWPQLLDEPDPGRLLARRVRQFADELNFDARRLRDWGIAQAVQSAVCSVEESGDSWQFPIAVAGLLSAIRL